MANVKQENPRFSGVLTPVITPYNSDYSPDTKRLTRQCQWMLSQHVGLAIFGTNSEGNSLSTDEKIGLMDALVDAGIDAKKNDAGYGMLRLIRHYQVNRPCDGSGVRWCTDATPILLQERKRRWALCKLC